MAMLRSRTLKAAVAAVAVALASPLPAWACGGLFCMNVPVDQAGERILFATDGQQVTAYVQLQYQGPAKDFSWIVPVPTKPEVSVGSDAVFQQLRAATRPTFNLNWLKDEGNCIIPTPNPAAGMPGSVTANDNGGGLISVEEKQVGPFDTAVIQANDSGALLKWLRENNYVIPPALDPMLTPYIDGKYYFLALKLQKDKEAGDMQPIVFKYDSTKPGIPIRLTAVAATEDMGVWVWVLGDKRAVPENYKHAEINEARIDWLNGGGNYPAVVTEAMNEAQGQAFVTDYAGDSSKVDAKAFDRTRFDLAKLKTLTEPVAFAEAIVEQGFFGERFQSLDSTKLVAFLKRYIPKPASVTDDDTQFYRFIANYREQLAANQSAVDTAAAVAELEEKVLKPMDDLKAMFGRHKYLTALYTTLSPAEMTQDPMFVFNGELPKVSNVHEADAVRMCSSGVPYYSSPIRIKLKSGLTFNASESAMPAPGGTAGAAAAIEMPAAARIEQLKATGQASLIADNNTKIRSALASAGALASGPDNATTGASARPTGSTAVAVDPASGKAVAVPAPGATRPAGSSSRASGGASSGNAGGPAASGGFGCAGCANPAKTSDSGKGEGLAFALVALGLAGWRLRARRK